MAANGEADPQMTALFLWHGAEELEHSAVAFDAFQAVSGSCFLRAGIMAIAAASLPVGLVAGATVLLVADSQVRRPPAPRQISRAMREGRVPTLRSALRGVVGYCRPGHHPSQAFRPETAVAYLNGNAPGMREPRSAGASANCLNHFAGGRRHIIAVLYNQANPGTVGIVWHSARTPCPGPRPSPKPTATSRSPVVSDTEVDAASGARARVAAVSAEVVHAMWEGADLNLKVAAWRVFLGAWTTGR